MKPTKVARERSASKRMLASFLIKLDMWLQLLWRIVEPCIVIAHVDNEMYMSRALERLGGNALSKDQEPDIGAAFFKFAVVTKELSALMKTLLCLFAERARLAAAGGNCFIAGLPDASRGGDGANPRQTSVTTN
ncbi:ArfGAP with SH3 domain, ANK repeat and PH domain-containing protein [Eumeta japonica]|uniref:ArfGAP with SH3 domain, ANK repeat and PH domain-containing protein n=1 Tax=Eumeta variegata TaxID=151549 RepID=A0A4C1TIN3_EUMVA|nr:ArfGAP with SH3 domain, ANK repeat and PH domain-containing protein [Eumeta japonica]